MSDPRSTLPPPVVSHTRTDADDSAKLSDWDFMVAAPSTESSGTHALQPGIEALLERLRVSDARRSGAMDRLENMLDQWSESDAQTVTPRASAPLPRPRADVVSMVRPASVSEAPLMAFASESASQSPTKMFLRARGVSHLGHAGEVVAWRPEAARERHEPRPAPAATVAAPQPPQRDAAHTVAGRLDALELALVVTKGELDRVTARHAVQQRRSLVAALLVFVCVVLVCVVIAQSERRADRMRADIAVAQQRAEQASRQADELASALRRVTDARAFVPR